MDNLGQMISYVNIVISVILLTKMFKNGVVDGLNAKRITPYIIFALWIMVTSTASSSYLSSVYYLKTQLIETEASDIIFQEAIYNQISLCRKLGWGFLIQNMILTFTCLEILNGIKVKMELLSKKHVNMKWDLKEVLNRR